MQPTERTPQPKPITGAAEQLPPTKNTNHKKRNIILAVITVLLIVAGITAYALTKDKKQEPVQVTQTEQKDNNIQVGEYLEIPEIGVRLKFPAEITDAYYILDKSYSNNGRDWAFISTKTLKNLDPGCSAEDDSRLAPGYVSYFTDPNEPAGPVEGSTISDYYPDNFKLGDKYVFYSTYQQSPCYQPETTSEEKTGQIDTIYKLFKQARVEGINSPKTDPSTPSDKDVIEINKLLDSFCDNNDGKDVTKTSLQEKDTFGAQRFYNGYAQVGAGCESENGGYISYMQRQTDLTWKQLVGAQDILDCEKTDQYKIPKEILPKCTTSQGQSQRPNTN